MKCSYHPTEEAAGSCHACSRPLCVSCAHQIQGKTYCSDCLVRGAEWAAFLKAHRVPTDAPKRAALCALIPGMGAVYNNDYLKGITYFAVFAALVMMSERVHGVFGFGAFCFLIFTMFDAYRTAEAEIRARAQAGLPDAQTRDRSVANWGVFLMALGTILLLQNLISFHFLNRLWPALFILLGAYLVYFALRSGSGKEMQ